jgi:hypothetical protein
MQLNSSRQNSVAGTRRSEYLWWQTTGVDRATFHLERGLNRIWSLLTQLPGLVRQAHLPFRSNMKITATGVVERHKRSGRERRWFTLHTQ